MKSTIITKGIETSQVLREYIIERVDMALDHVYDSIHFVTVRISDLNGPKGGIDKRCKIHFKLSGLPAIVVSEVSASIDGAIDGATQRLAKVVDRLMSRVNAINPINVPVLRRIAIS